MSSRSRSGSLALLLAFPLLASGIAACTKQAPVAPVTLDLSTPAFRELDRPVAFEHDVKPVLESRCVVCHACYDAPCQLLLSSYPGAQRGATKQLVYDSTRLDAAPPTRMFIDAQTTEEWRARDFFSVLGARAGKGADASMDPLLLYMLALGRAHPFAEGERLPADVGLDIDRTLSCPASGEFEDYAREHPQGGMPYGMAPLRDEEIQILASWVAQGTPAPPAETLSARAQSEVVKWERFLNGDSLKERITSRYLYEHWFLAHLGFESFPTGPFFEIVRSRTAPGEPIDLIATVRPYDDPGVERVWYRLRPVVSTLVRKTHMVYPLSDAKLQRLRQLFLDSDWQPTEFPAYTPEVASNPFVAFLQMPPRSRYEYLLDDAQYFVMTFIRGPVCRGQVAVDVIEDQFWVAFMDPSHDPSVVIPDFLAKTAHLLDLPAEHGSDFGPGELWLEYARKQRKYLEARAKFYDEIDPKHRGPALDWVWDGERTNPNALLTIFRNYDNAEVVKGFVGEIPKTAWVMDFPIFERIYYNLVAGFDIYGNVSHQVATRLYMDHLRMQSENIFLGLLPSEMRNTIRASWYIGATRSLSYAIADRIRTLGHGTQIHYKTSDPKAEVLEMIMAHAGAAAGPPDLINRCTKLPCELPGASATQVDVEHELRLLASVKGDFVPLLPEVAFLRVRVPGPGNAQGESDLVYSLVHNDAHTNVAFMFGADKRRIPADDTLSVLRGHFGSYPNFFFEVDAAKIPAFVGDMLKLRSDADLERFVASYGIRRTSPRFWEMADWLRADLKRREPTTAGIYDLDRYKNL